MSIVIEGEEYELECDSGDPFVAPGLEVAFCDRLAADFRPVFLDPREWGSTPFPPDYVAYRLVCNPLEGQVCVIYEVYWRRQDCTWKEFNKDHEHDYEQVQIHFDLKTGQKCRVVVSSVGPVRHAGHGVEVYSDSRPVARDVVYTTSASEHFPWGGRRGREFQTQVRDVPVNRMVFEQGRPILVVQNCYHVFVGLKKSHTRSHDGREPRLDPRLVRLDRVLLERWYHEHSENRFGHDLSNPFREPYVMYYPPPEDLKSRLVYSLLRVFNWVRRLIRRQED